jgi:hypothetical protein
MNATQPQGNPLVSQNITVLHVLAELLERLDRSGGPVGAQQYLSVAQHLAREFAEVKPGVEVHALLETHPAAAELYENLNYEYAGLCRSALDVAVQAEAQAKSLIARAQLRPAGPVQPSPHQDKEDKHHGKS